jgi:hypothetical protein
LVVQNETASMVMIATSASDNRIASDNALAGLE